MSTPTFTVTAEDVFAKFKIPDASDARLEIMTDIITGIVGVVVETSIEWPDDTDDEAYARRLAATEQGIEYMANRVWARIGSPEGAAGFGADRALIRVARTDPDVEFFLGPWSNTDVPV
jgi:hypothetical protein